MKGYGYRKIRRYQVREGTHEALCKTFHNGKGEIPPTEVLICNEGFG